MRRRQSLPLVCLLGVASACISGREANCPIGSLSCACTAGGSCDEGLACDSGVCVEPQQREPSVCRDVADGRHVCSEGTLYRCAAGAARIAADCDDCSELFAGIPLSTSCQQATVRPANWDRPYPFEGPGCYSTTGRLVCGPVDNPPPGACVGQRIVADGSFHCEEGRLVECFAGTLSTVVDCTQCFFRGMVSDLNETTCEQTKRTPPDWTLSDLGYDGPGCYYGGELECY